VCVVVFAVDVVVVAIVVVAIVVKNAHAPVDIDDLCECPSSQISRYITVLLVVACCCLVVWLILYRR
jgi:hypothetical protein